MQESLSNLPQYAQGVSYPQCFHKSKKYPRPQLSSSQRQSSLSQPKTSSKHGAGEQDKKSQLQQLLNMKKYINIVGKFAHNHLYCRDVGELLTVSEATLLENQRNKYISYINKNYKYKFPEEMVSKKLMKEKRDQLLERQKAERLKKLFQPDVKAKKRSRVKEDKEGKQGTARKRVKVNEQGGQGTKQNKRKQKKQKQVKQPIKQKKQTKSKTQKLKDQGEQKEEQQVQQYQQQQQASENNFESQQDQNLQNKDLDQLDSS